MNGKIQRDLVGQALHRAHSLLFNNIIYYELVRRLWRISAMMDDHDSGTYIHHTVCIYVYSYKLLPITSY